MASQSFCSDFCTRQPSRSCLQQQLEYPPGDFLLLVWLFLFLHTSEKKEGHLFHLFIQLQTCSFFILSVFLKLGLTMNMNSQVNPQGINQYESIYFNAQSTHPSGTGRVCVTLQKYYLLFIHIFLPTFISPPFSFFYITQCWGQTLALSFLLCYQYTQFPLI